MRYGFWWVLLVALALIALACGGGGDDDDDGSNGDDATESGSGDDDGDDGGSDDGDDGSDDGDDGSGDDDGDGGTAGGDVCDVLPIEAVRDATGVDEAEAIDSGFANDAGTCTYVGVGGATLIGLLLLGGDSADFTWESNQDVPGAEEVDVDGAEAFWWEGLFTLYIQKGDYVAGVTILALPDRTSEEMARALAQTVVDGMPD